MSSNDENTVSIQVLDKEFLINCPREAQADLLASARYLNERMNEIKSAGRVFGTERIATMAALNLSHELLQARQELSRLSSKAQQLDDKVRVTLSNSSSQTTNKTAS